MPIGVLSSYGLRVVIKAGFRPENLNDLNDLDLNDRK